jgi:hypothetical protein
MGQSAVKLYGELCAIPSLLILQLGRRPAGSCSVRHASTGPAPVTAAMNNLPALPKFDFQAFFRDLPENLQQPAALAAFASLGFHGLFFATLPVMTSSDAEANPERITPIITLTPEEQARLPQQAGGGLPLPMTSGRSQTIGPAKTTFPPTSSLGLPPLPVIPSNPSSGYDFTKGAGSGLFDPLPSSAGSSTTTDYSSLFPRITRTNPPPKVEDPPKRPAAKEPVQEPPLIDTYKKYEKPAADPNSPTTTPPPPELPAGQLGGTPVPPGSPPGSPTSAPDSKAEADRRQAALNADLQQRAQRAAVEAENLKYVAAAPSLEANSTGGGAGFTKSYSEWLNNYIIAKLPTGLSEEQIKNQGDEIAGQIDYQQIKPPKTLPPLTVAAPIGPTDKPFIVRMMIFDGKIDGPMLVSSTGNLQLDRAIGVSLKPYVEALIKQGQLTNSDNSTKPYRNYEFSLPLQQAPAPTSLPA